MRYYIVFSFNIFINFLGFCQIQDVEDNIYNTIQLGNQIWLASNLNASKFANGDDIIQAISDADWVRYGNTSTPAWCYYNGDDTNVDRFGKLYNGYVVSDDRGVCPQGWHIPSSTEWNRLEEYLFPNIGDKIKAKGWWNEKMGDTNQSGFTAQPAGIRNSNGEFKAVNNLTCWWSTTENQQNFLVKMLTVKDNELKLAQSLKSSGNSIRCIKDKN